MRRILFLLITLLTCQLTRAFCVDGIYYNTYGSNVTVTSGGSSYSGSVTIPASVTYQGTTYTVTSIGNYAFYNCTGLTSVTIPNSVTSIGYSAFYNCTGLNSVTIPNSVTSIGNGAFSACIGLTSVSIPNSVTSIGSFAFKDCSEMRTLIIEDGDSELSLNVDYNPFKNCPIEDLYVGRNLSFWRILCNSSCLKQVGIGNSVTSIGNWAFAYCSGLTSVTIGNSVTSIGDSAFEYCSGITSVTIPSSITSIGSYAFRGCSGLTSVTIPSSVTSIGCSTFSYCNALKTLIIEDGESTLSVYSSESINYPFNGCVIEKLYVGRNLSSWQAFCNPSSLKEVEIGNLVTSIGSFSGCSNLASVIIGNAVTTLGERTFSGCKGLTSVTIGNSVTAIGSEAFRGCSGLTSMTIPNAVTSIGSYAFNDCSGLTSVTIPNSVTSIGSGAFYDCSGLTSITIPQSVTTIGSQAFYYCQHISVDLSKSELTMNANAFNGVKSLIVGEKVTVSGSASYCGINNLVWLANSSPKIPGAGVTYTASSLNYLSSWFKVDGFTYVPLSPSERTCILIDCDYIANGDTSIILPEKVTYKGIEFAVTQLGNYLMARQDQITDVVFRAGDEAIPNGMFLGCTVLPEFEIPETVTSIGHSAFSDCSGLTSVTIPKSVSSIGDAAFSGCTGLTLVNIPNSVTSLSSNVFSGCSGLTSVTIPESVTAIGDYAFNDCSSLTEVTIPNSITSIGNLAFYGCATLTSVTIPNSVTSIGRSAFGYCNGLKEVSIGNSVASIGNSAFYECSGLKEVSIGNSVASIDDSAFYGCTSLTEVTIPNSVTSIDSSAFSNCDALTDVAFEDGEKSIYIYSSAFGDGIENLRIGRNLSSSSTFANISTLKSAWITDIPTSIASGTFQDCSNLDFVYVGDNVTAIGDRAFSGCSSLTLFQFGKNVTSIGADALADCTGITNIYAESLTPPSVATQALDDLDRWNCTLHVQAAAMDAYKAADQWKEFFFYDSDFAIVLSDEAISLEPGQTYQLAAYTDSDHTTRAVAAEAEVRWVSTNPNVAVVDQKGFVVGTGSGKCSIAAFNSDNVMANCLVNIVTEVERVITLDTYNLEIDINETHQFHANVDAATLTWSSSDPDVAEIDAYGFMTAKSQGTTLITAANNNGDSVSCLVTVKEKPAGLENITEDSFDIRVEGSELVIEGLPDDALVHVFTLDGKLVYSGYERRISLQSGEVYIVAYPGGTRKIAL